MSRTRVLVITIQYAPDLGSSAPIYTALCEDLAQLGYDVDVITGFPHVGQGRVWPEYSGKIWQEEKRNKVRVFRSYVYAKKTRLWQRLLYFASFNVLATWLALRIQRPDVIIADGPSLWCGLPTLVKAIWPNTPFIYVVHDIYPDMAVRLKVIANKSAIRLLDRMEKFFYRKASYVSVLADGFKENLLRKGVSNQKLVVIPACTDVDFIQPLSRESKFRRLWGLQGKFIVLYTASIGLPQGLDNLVRAAKFLAEYPDMAIVFVGEGNAKSFLQAMVRDEGIGNVFFFPMQSREDVPEVFGLADVSIVSLKRDIAMEAVPSKTYSIMASARPVIATVQSQTEVARLLKQANCGLLIEPENPRALADGISRLHADASLRQCLGLNGRKYVVENYSRDVAARKYQALIQSLARC